jgi:hypothetical protein
MADFGIKITKSGYDVGTATVLEQTFNSEKNSLKIAFEGSTTSTASGDRTVQIAHGLSVVPAYLCFFQADSNGRWYPCFTIEDQTGKNCTITPFTDSTYLQIPIHSDSSATIKVYYYVIVDPAQ